ncbi:cornifin-A-like isoform X2 [Psammomys obesus]|uniref:cornifin-A-like isoform X2 n=1 Tax=Psammomys obesus TaxID=48139 RepID=UPI0024531C95|nr:cornifin-A-like isoform X2 [Psammomys obesus]
MSSYQQKQPFVVPPQPQEHQVKQPCQPPSQGQFEPITTTGPCHTDVPQPGNTKIPEPCNTKVPEPCQSKIPEACPTTVTPELAQQKTKQK